ncbi:hypothetical protein FQA39_LY13997 [Lamprigera yunnana]|nr:hypothetical protein FQA39_LY13997 [Lamprigera yunnana]
MCIKQSAGESSCGQVPGCDSYFDDSNWGEFDNLCAYHSVITVVKLCERRNLAVQCEYLALKITIQLAREYGVVGRKDRYGELNGNDKAKVVVVVMVGAITGLTVQGLIPHPGGYSIEGIVLTVIPSEPDKVKVLVNAEIGIRKGLQKYHLNRVRLGRIPKVGLSKATVYVITTVGSVNLEYFFWRGIGNVKGNDFSTAPNGSRIQECQCVGTL